MRRLIGYLAVIGAVLALAFGATTIAAVAAPHVRHTHAAKRAEARHDAAVKRKAAGDRRGDALAVRKDAAQPDTPEEEQSEEAEEKEEQLEEANEEKETDEEEIEEQEEENEENEEDATETD